MAKDYKYVATSEDGSVISQKSANGLVLVCIYDKSGHRNAMFELDKDNTLALIARLRESLNTKVESLSDLYTNEESQNNILSLLNTQTEVLETC